MAAPYPTLRSWQAAEPDALREEAAQLVAELNRARVEDVLRIAGFATGAGMDRLEGAELLWVDRLGLYLLAAVRGEGAQARAAACQGSSSHMLFLFC